jgi:glycosyltransferase involved in cell wall biosynthesis
MKVAIINMTHGGMSGGYRKYLLNIMPRLAYNSNIDSLLCLSPASLQVDTWFKKMQNVEFVNCSPFGIFNFRFDRSLKQRLKQFSPDLIFIPVTRFFEFFGVPVLNMVQNILPFLYKGVEGLSFSEKLQLGFKHYESMKALKRADRTIVTSSFVKNLLTEKRDLPERKISLVYFGRDSLTETVIKPVAIPSGLQKKYLFTAGSLEPYRGIEDIIGAVKCLKNDCFDLKVVIAGQARAQTLSYQRKLLELIKSYNLELDIIWTGQLSQGELAWCYQNCAAFIMTSRMETFGLVALEAMSNGCLCIAAENPPLPEIYLDSACYYPPKDPCSLAKAIKELLGWNKEKKIAMAEKAKERSEYFTWDKAVDGLINEFKTTIESR